MGKRKRRRQREAGMRKLPNESKVSFQQRLETELMRFGIRAMDHKP